MDASPTKGLPIGNLETHRPLGGSLKGAAITGTRVPDPAVRLPAAPDVQPRDRAGPVPIREAREDIPQNRELRNANVAREATSSAQASALDSKHPEASPLQDIKTTGSENLDLNFGNRYGARRPHEDELRQTPPLHVDSSNPVHRNAFRRAVAARTLAFAEALRKVGVEVMQDERPTPSRLRAAAASNGELRIFVRDDLADRFWDEARGHHDVGLDRLEKTMDEEATHVATLKALREEWDGKGRREDFVQYLNRRAGEVIQDALDAVHSLPAGQQKAGREALWSAWKSYFGTGNKSVTPENIMEHLSDHTAHEAIANNPAPFVLETVRQLSQMRRLGVTTETVHQFLDRLTELGARILQMLKAVAFKLKDGVLGKQMQDLVERTDQALQGGTKPFVPQGAPRWGEGFEGRSIDKAPRNSEAQANAQKIADTIARARSGKLILHESSHLAPRKVYPQSPDSHRAKPLTSWDKKLSPCLLRTAGGNQFHKTISPSNRQAGQELPYD